MGGNDSRCFTFDDPHANAEAVVEPLSRRLWHALYRSQCQTADATDWMLLDIIARGRTVDPHGFRPRAAELQEEFGAYTRFWHGLASLAGQGRYARLLAPSGASPPSLVTRMPETLEAWRSLVGQMPVTPAALSAFLMRFSSAPVSSPTAPPAPVSYGPPLATDDAAFGWEALLAHEPPDAVHGWIASMFVRSQPAMQPRSVHET